MDNLHVNRFSSYYGNATGVASTPELGIFEMDPSEKPGELIDRVILVVRLRNGRNREVSFTDLIRGCTARGIFLMLGERGVMDIRESARRDTRPKLGLAISDEAWRQVCAMVPKTYGCGGINMGILLKILVTRPDIAGKLLEGAYL
jgi:hypothetical protein